MPSRKTNAANLYGGGAAPLQFTHTQTIAASTWTIDHHFGVPGSLRAVAYDNGGIWMPIVGIQAVGENQAVVTFDQPRAGRVENTIAQTEAKPIDVSNLDVPLSLTVSEINFLLTLAGQQPYNNVANLIGKMKGQAEAHIQRVTAQLAGAQEADGATGALAQ